MAVCGKCVHKKACWFCKDMGFEYSVRAHDFKCEDYLSTVDVAPKSEIAKEIFAEIIKELFPVENRNGELIVGISFEKYEELKKKYTEE